MESTCPNCKKKNEHEDYLFEVACTCGSRYNPFMALEETPAAAEAPAAAEPQFAEANAAFADIRSFGDESMNAAVAAAPESEAGFTDLSAPPPAGSAPAPMPSTGTTPAPRAAGGAVLAGPAMEPMPPVSACVDFDGSLPNPLEPLVNQLWEKASGAGASACTEVRWAFSPDGQKIVGSAVPVRRA